ncbi:MAG TPA: phospholipid carrier-dependent glycosyltransferase [Trebonia sp.]|nr:phospholipid carrier-dependent glycosyltransferase [Trebonia sp.]
MQGEPTNITQPAAWHPRRAPLALRRLARENKLFTWALAAGAVVRLFAVLGYPGALWFAGDTYVYLGAALRPQPNLSKSTGYSFFLRALLPFHSLTLVVVLQHLMGLTDAVLIYALLRRNKVSKTWATIASLPMLLDGYIIEDEHLIMTEALYTFLVMVAMALLLWKPKLTWWKALLIGLLIGYAVIVHTEGTAVVACFPLFALLSGRAWKKLSGWGLTIVMCLGILVPVGGYAAWFHERNGHYDTSLAEGFFLWGRVSSFANCAVIKPTGEMAKICPTQPIADRTPPGDYIWHAPYVHASKLNPGFSPVTAANDQLLTSFAIKAIEAQPLGYAKAVVRGVLLSFGFPRIGYPDPGTTYYYEFHAHYVTAKYNMLPPDNSKNPADYWIPGGTAGQDWLSYGHQAPGVVDKVFAYPLIAYQRVVFTWGPLLAIIFLIGLGGVFSVRRRGWNLKTFRLRWKIRGTSMAPWITAAALLVTPVMVGDFDYRYLIPVIPLASLAAGLAFAPSRRQDAGDPAAPSSAAAAAAETTIADQVA